MTFVRKLIRADGKSEVLPGPVSIGSACELIHADALDTVRLRDSYHVMLLDDNGHTKNLPINHEATRLYHEVCRRGTRWPIRGDVIVAPDDDFADDDERSYAGG